MNNRKTNYLILACIFMHFASCKNFKQENNEAAKPTQQQEKIIELDYASAGGSLGYQMSFQLRPDSTIYLLENHRDTTKRKTFRKATNAAFWQSLTKDIDLDKIAKIKTGESRQPYDGVDIRLAIRTNKRVIQFTNGETDTLHFPAAQKIMDQINDTLTQFDKH